MTAQSSLPLDKAPQRIAGMFDEIAGRYDFLNRLLSAGLDRSWRTRAVRSLNLGPHDIGVDLCTGTADLALAMVQGGGAGQAIGIDFAAEMLRYGCVKTRTAGLNKRIGLLQGDATQLPVGDATAAGVTIGFGIRNVADPSAVLQEVYRILRRGGRLAILEFGYPSLAPIRAAYLVYLRFVLPLIGRMISGHASAYTYLPASVGTFYRPDVFCEMLADTGFTETRSTPLTAGVVYLYEAVKPDVM